MVDEYLAVQAKLWRVIVSKSGPKKYRKASEDFHYISKWAKVGRRAYVFELGA